jgi:hypothetical protein
MKALLQERIMSAATLDEYTSVKTRSGNAKPVNSNDSVLAERARILETVARKAQEKTLTLQETTDLYARFNRTYETGYQSKSQPQEDESWALQLLEECARENEANNALQTRVNGEPQVQQALKLVKPSQSIPKNTARPARSSDSNKTLEQMLFADEPAQADKPKLNLRDAFIYDQFNFTEEDTGQNARNNANRLFWIILSFSGLFTLATLIALSHFI